MFIVRAAELAFLNDVMTREHPGPGQFVMLYGRRRVGKTALLRAWAEQSGLPFTYWVAEKDPAPLSAVSSSPSCSRAWAVRSPCPPSRAGPSCGAA
jgi:lipocalin